MRFLCKHITIWIATFYVFFCNPVIGFAQNITAVLSSDLGPYREAYEGFREVFDGPITQINLKTDAFSLDRDTRLVVAFGGKAALQDYPPNVTVIYCMAPGVRLYEKSIKVPMMPSAVDVIDRLLIIQPNLQRLATIWASDAQADFLRDLALITERAGIALISERVVSSEDLPDRLRKVLRQGVDAVWLPPDPVLINARSFSVFKSFSWSNNVPLYVPTSGLVDKGAVAAVSSSFRDIGRTVGNVVIRALKENIDQSIIYPLEVELKVNPEAAANTGLEIDQNELIEKGATLP